MFARVSLVALTISLMMPSAARADDAVAESDTIIVTGKIEGYRTIETTSGTKTNTPILNVPQAISVVTEQQLRDQQILSIADLVRYIPGVSAGQGEGHRDQITLRGNNSTADFFVDGLRDDVQYFRSFYNIERVEVHKGPNAMVFGRGGGGGVLNRVSKGALVDQNLVAGTVSLNSFGGWYAATDVNAPIGSAALRVNGFYESLENHRDAYDGHRLGINPVVGAEIGDGVKVQLGYEYARDSRTVDRGIPSLGGRPISGFRDEFFGVEGVNQSGLTAHILRFRGEAKLSQGLTLSTQALYGDYDKAYTNVFAASAVSAGLVSFEAYRDPTSRRNFIGQTNLEWRGSTGGIDHLLLIGAEYTSQQTGNERINGFFDGVPVAQTSSDRRRVNGIALTFPLAIPAVTFRAGAGNRSVATDLKQVSFYVQDQISFGDKVDLIAGLRYDNLDLGFTNRATSTSFSRADNLWSPRAGLVFKPVPNASLYISYAKSYLPQSGDQFLTLDATLANLKPETFDNYEAGAKWDIKPGLTATVAVYRLDRANTRATVNNITVTTGAQRTRGVEIGLTGNITTNWQVALGYANTKAQITQTTTAAPAGRAIGQVPRHQFSLWNRFDLSERLGLGVGLYRQTKSFTSISNSTVLPAYTRLDAAVFFKLSDKIDAQINVENLTDSGYFPVAHNDNNISTGAPINARFTVNVKF